MSDFLFYAAVVGFCIGIAFGTFYTPGLPAIVWLFGMALVLGLLWRRAEVALSTRLLLLLSVCLLASGLGLLRSEIATWHQPSALLSNAVGKEITLTGTIVREPDVRERTQHLYVAVTGTDETILVYAERYGNYNYGDRVSVTGELRIPETFATDLGRTFNYPGYLTAQGVSYAVSFAEITVSDTGGGNPFIAAVLNFKQTFMDSLESLVPEPAVGLGEGLLLGVKQALGDEWEHIFRQTGIIHIVVLSGYNIALVVIFVRYFLSYLLPYRAQLVVGVVAIAAFALMVGLSATVLRASLMASFILFAKYIGRTYAVMRGLMLAGIAMLLINPHLLIYDVGFQLSFLATMGLILLAPQIERWFLWMPTAFKLREFLLATIATQIFVLPILLYQIGEFSVVSVLVNVLVLPMVPVAMLLTFSTGMIGLVSTSLAVPFVYLTTWSLQYILGLAAAFASLPFAAYTVPTFSFWLVPISYAALAAGIWWYAYRTPELSDVAHWTIEEEETLRARALKQSSTSTPIFFN